MASENDHVVFLSYGHSRFLFVEALVGENECHPPGKGYQFHLSQLLLLILGLAYAIIALFVRRPNQDDVVYFHRALTQLLHLNQPISVRQTSVDMDAATFSPVHLATSYEMLMACLGNGD